MPDDNKALPDRADTVRTFARIGLLSFGGPAAQIAVMHRILVEEKNWLSETQFLHALNFCMLLPGPEAMQLATYAGWRLGGVRLGFIAGALFVLPGLAMMLALSVVYILAGDVPWVAALLYGLKAAVLAVVLQALLKVSGRALGSAAMMGIAVAAFAALALFGVPFPIVIAGAALLGAALSRFAPEQLPHAAAIDEAPPEGARRGALADTIAQAWPWVALWLVPLAALIMVAGPSNVFAQAGLFFSQTAIVTFGGAYAVLAYVAQQAVEFYGWLSADDMLKGLGLAETTLGPLVLVLVFVGFMAGASQSGLDPVTGGLLGGLVAAFFTFVPCFVWIFAGAPHVERLRHVRWLAASLAAITAAVVGVIANLAVWFGLGVLFGPFQMVRAGPIRLPDIDWGQPDWLAVAIAVSSAIALIRFKFGLLPVLAASALAGLLTLL